MEKEIENQLNALKCELMMLKQELQQVKNKVHELEQKENDRTEATRFKRTLTQAGMG